jgi:NTP pyrophosphatase (non-canonical NTP hydrolase)
MNLLNYQNLAMRTNDKKNTERMIKSQRRCSMNADVGGIVNASLGLSGEVGELNDMIKKWMFHGHDLSIDDVKKELGDCLWYIAMMCESFGFSMEEIAQKNINKLIERYPEGFSEYASQNRKEYKA